MYVCMYIYIYIIYLFIFNTCALITFNQNNFSLLQKEGTSIHSHETAAIENGNDQQSNQFPAYVFSCSRSCFTHLIRKERQLQLLFHANFERFFIETRVIDCIDKHMKSSFAKTNNSIFIFFQKSHILLRIPSNINQTAVGLF